MSKIEKSCEVDVPVRVAYDQWTQFEDFPRFMDNVEEVRQVDDSHLHWRANLSGKRVEWDAEIYEQVPDQVIAWRSTSGAPNSGVVRFESLGAGRCRVRVTMDVEPRSFGEKVGTALGATGGQISADLERFKKFIETRTGPTGGWRGEIHGGDVEPPSTTV